MLHVHPDRAPHGRQHEWQRGSHDPPHDLTNCLFWTFKAQHVMILTIPTENPAVTLIRPSFCFSSGAHRAHTFSSCWGEVKYCL